MNDRELCERFGTTLEEVEEDVAKYEKGDFSDMEFGTPIDGRPKPKTKTTSFKLFDFELEAIDRAAEEEGISLSPFIRRACDNELIALS